MESSQGWHSKTTCVVLLMGEDAARLLQRHSATAAAAELVGKCRNLSSSGPGARHNRLVFVMDNHIGAIARKRCQWSSLGRCNKVTQEAPETFGIQLNKEACGEVPGRLQGHLTLT